LVVSGFSRITLHRVRHPCPFAYERDRRAQAAGTHACQAAYQVTETVPDAAIARSFVMSGRFSTTAAATIAASNGTISKPGCASSSSAHSSNGSRSVILPIYTDRDRRSNDSSRSQEGTRDH
jgi:hypothetical protein